MISKEQAVKLAQLARIEVSEAELGEVTSQISSILEYVSQIDSARSGGVAANYELLNVFREDGNGHESGIYTEKLLSEAPKRNGQYVQVKKIL